MTHIMLSYNWYSQELVKQLYIDLTEKGILCWMDIQGGIKVDINTSMSEGVEKAAVVVCFCTEQYQKSENCKKELTYAVELERQIIPIICDDKYTRRSKRSEKLDSAKWPCEWLGILIAGKLYVDFRNKSYISCLESLVEKIQTAQSNTLKKKKNPQSNQNRSRTMLATGWSTVWAADVFKNISAFKKKSKHSDHLVDMYEINIAAQHLPPMDKHNNSSDPYFKLFVDEKLAYKSKIIENELEPRWEMFKMTMQPCEECGAGWLAFNGEFFCNIVADSSLKFEVFDDDVITDDFIGTCCIGLTNLISEESTKLRLVDKYGDLKNVRSVLTVDVSKVFLFRNTELCEQIN